jgi:hypothetical protein
MNLSWVFPRGFFYLPIILDYIQPGTVSTIASTVVSFFDRKCVRCLTGYCHRFVCQQTVMHQHCRDANPQSLGSQRPCSLAVLMDVNPFKLKLRQLSSLGRRRTSVGIASGSLLGVRYLLDTSEFAGNVTLQT